MTGLVTLRPAVEADRDQVRAWRNADHVREHMYTDHLIGAEEHARWWRAALTDPTRRLWIVRHGDREVGLVALSDISAGSADWAIYIGAADALSAGAGRGALTASIDQAFDTLGLETIFCEVLVTNEKARRLYERSGFERVAALPRRAVKQDRPVDALRLKLTRERWRARRAEETPQ